MIPSELVKNLHARDVALLAGRLLLSLIFVHEGLQLATHFEGAQKAMAALGVGTPLLIATILLQLGAGLSVALGILARLGAIGLGLFCLMTASLFHTNFASQNELLHFEKDLAIAGGMFILALAGSGRLSVDRVLVEMMKGRAGASAKVDTTATPGEPHLSTGVTSLPV
ncbi:DoxX family protein [Mesorhizobium sp. M2D.F.Ca.ET.185.01.1.1]|uniref:DoxX family protein n=1 Tax=unclassified Mesorhizobium TaxID=325217 RepID=UPI000FCCC38B|nr:MULTISPECIES: DoxX family protein [unclassified Mesorhizobium]TGP76443.1 DoxX family protein [bacterium M00.F.Ca.ET.227.01.1.1]TGP92494.1 DoxX family protein [bacterium M00.F.Ca.ET.222.01.1.1]TGP97049.1 DoxX family protein [bacterium M00.F.Ca.ET.221.01.1.1]TGU06492.1 DoxX family protein [bacterium M00.F.Ca.ET.163.01.1.1]TGU27884.1 DoxX family protein [bacterium M00.F.Ca.ET.156.01.1.1]TGU50260.1 DoxX family protein [bacterium M00.F.Ca.ET.146.01.1.1]TGV68221.1 DoxX family protein [Mesorhizo